MVLAEECYINLSRPDICPRCSTAGSGVIYSGGPARTWLNHYKVVVNVYSCSHLHCLSGYTVAEVID